MRSKFLEITYLDYNEVDILDGDGNGVGDGDDGGGEADKVLMKSAPQGKGSLGGSGVITKTSKLFLIWK